MRASSTLAAAFSPGSVLTMWATAGSPVSSSSSTWGIVLPGIVWTWDMAPVNHVGRDPTDEGSAERGEAVPHLQALRQTELFQLAHVRLERGPLTPEPPGERRRDHPRVLGDQPQRLRRPRPTRAD